MWCLCGNLYIYFKVYPVWDTQVGDSLRSLDTFKVLTFLAQRIFPFATCWQMATERNKIKATAQVWIRLEKYASAESISLQEVQLGPFGPPVKMQTGRCLHFLSFVFSSRLSCANLTVMSGEAYCRENVYSSISSVERFSVEGCILCLPACRGGAPPLVLGPQLFVFLIGFFCEEQKSGGTHADVVCNQSRKQASEFILGDAHGDSDSVAWHFGVSPLSRARLKLTRAVAKSHTAHHHSSWVHLGNMMVGLNMWYLSIWHCFFFFFLLIYMSYTVIIINTVRCS